MVPILHRAPPESNRRRCRPYRLPRLHHHQHPGPDRTPRSTALVATHHPSLRPRRDQPRQPPNPHDRRTRPRPMGRPQHRRDHHRRPLPRKRHRLPIHRLAPKHGRTTPHHHTPRTPPHHTPTKQPRAALHHHHRGRAARPDLLATLPTLGQQMGLHRPHRRRPRP